MLFSKLWIGIVAAVLLSASLTNAEERNRTELSGPGEDRISCIIDAARSREVPASILLAIMELEIERPGLLSQTATRTVEIGLMQFNSSYQKNVAPSGVRTNSLARSGCDPYQLAAWRLRGHLDHDRGDLWTRAANYRSRTPHRHRRYRSKLILIADRWENWLREKLQAEATELRRDLAATELGN